MFERKGGGAAELKEATGKAKSSEEAIRKVTLSSSPIISQPQIPLSTGSVNIWRAGRPIRVQLIQTPGFIDGDTRVHPSFKAQTKLPLL